MQQFWRNFRVLEIWKINLNYECQQISFEFEKNWRNTKLWKSTACSVNRFHGSNGYIGVCLADSFFHAYTLHCILFTLIGECLLSILNGHNILVTEIYFSIKLTIESINFTKQTVWHSRCFKILCIIYYTVLMNLDGHYVPRFIWTKQPYQLVWSRTCGITVQWMFGCWLLITTAEHFKYMSKIHFYTLATLWTWRL